MTVSQELYDEGRRMNERLGREYDPTFKSSTFLNTNCLECSAPRFRVDTRYCKRCYKYFLHKEAEDIRSGKSKHKDYGYSLAGWNSGLNAWIHDKDHFKQMERLAAMEGMIQQ